MVNHVDAKAFHKALQEKKNNPKVKFIDVRTPGEYRASHIEDVENFPLDQIEARSEEFKNFKEIYIQCGTGARSAQAAKKIRQHKMVIFDFCGGLTEWTNAGYPVIEKKGTLPIIRQVMITAGSLVLLGAIASLLGYSYGVYLAGFIGAGLLFSGVSGWCGMALVLGKMPWNK
jgi:rhodanese-related sulfurtransferase